jgi:hypothetical protein
VGQTRRPGPEWFADRVAVALDRAPEIPPRYRTRSFLVDEMRRAEGTLAFVVPPSLRGDHLAVLLQRPGGAYSAISYPLAEIHLVERVLRLRRQYNQEAPVLLLPRISREFGRFVAARALRKKRIGPVQAAAEILHEATAETGSWALP